MSLSVFQNRLLGIRASHWYLDWADRLPEETSEDCELLFGVEDVAEWDTDEPHAVVSRVGMLAALERLLYVVVTNEKLFRVCSLSTSRSFPVSPFKNTGRFIRSFCRIVRVSTRC